MQEVHSLGDLRDRSGLAGDTLGRPPGLPLCPGFQCFRCLLRSTLFPRPAGSNIDVKKG